MTNDETTEQNDEDTRVVNEVSGDEPEDTIDTAAAQEPAVDVAPAVDGSTVASGSLDPIAVESSTRKWHDRKWLLVTIVAVVSLVLGVAVSVPDRQAAKDEAQTILSAANSDAAETEDDAQNEADEIVEGAESEREELLGGVNGEKVALLDDIAAAKDQLTKLKDAARTARTNLTSTEKTRVAKQKQLNGINRAIRASTTLSRTNAVGAAQDYLDYSSFSCQGLIQQLEYEKYSNSDATYAAKQVGLC